jgi:hypothetical protein
MVPKEAAAEEVEEGVAAGEEEASVEEQEAIEEPQADEPAEEVEAQADGFAEEEDPYATGGLVRRIREEAPAPEEGEGDRPFTTFDWRGRPIT